MNSAVELNDNSIAIIGMSCQTPGAEDLNAFWHMIHNGQEGISHFDDAELTKHGVSAEQLTQPNFVRSAAYLQNIDLFDADFFGISEKEAKLMDPQHRLFLQHAYTALETANILTNTASLRTGVFAGSSMSSYLMQHWPLLKPKTASPGEWAQIIHHNGPEHLALRTAYKLNLTGPVLSVQTACSTSLTAVHLAIQSLLMQECDAAIAGGISIVTPQSYGYQYEVSSICSKDGHCRPFSSDASGTLFGSGVGVVALKRLEDALAAHDHIYAIIKGSAMNNDGKDKMHYTAPSAAGQQAVIEEALAVSQVSPDTLGYFEAHGTGTSLGDPIEIKAATQAYQKTVRQHGYCYLGSVKANVGHLNAAAGVIGLIKATLALHHQEIPPLINFTTPNNEIDFAHSPFALNTAEAQNWPKPLAHPRRAAVSSFGIGGTNVHVILEEAPTRISQPSQLTDHIIVWSAQTTSRLERLTKKLVAYLESTDDNIADIAYTLQSTANKGFAKRRYILCRSKQDALNKILAGTFNPKGPHPLIDQAAQWYNNQPVIWDCYPNELRLKVVTPTSPFEMQSYWLSSPVNTTPETVTQGALGVKLTPITTQLPDDELVQILQAIWTELLEISNIDNDDSFYELGGDSLLATQMLTRLQAQFPIDFSLTMLDACPSIRLLAIEIERALEEKLNHLSEDEVNAMLNDN